MYTYFMKEKTFFKFFSFEILPAIATTSLSFVLTSTVTSESVCPGVGITLTCSFILNSSPVKNEFNIHSRYDYRRYTMLCILYTSFIHSIFQF